MTDRFSGRARLPGPLSPNPFSPSGPHPGLLSLATLVVSQSAAPHVGGAVKTFVMPLLAPQPQTNKKVHPMTEPLYNKNGPAFGDVKQSSSLINCPVAAILAALAHTGVGSQFIRNKMIVEQRRTSGSVETDIAQVISKLATDDEEDEEDEETPAPRNKNAPRKKTKPPPVTKIKSDRFFQVRVGGQTIEVSDVFYTDDADRNWSLIYMSSPTDALWPAVVEKALAAMLGGYAKLDGTQITANDFWKTLVGSAPEQLSIKDVDETNPKSATPLKDILDLAKAARSVPTVGASRDSGTKKVTGFHGHVILHVDGKGVISVYDPMAVKTITLTAAEFRADFKAILSGKP